VDLDQEKPDEEPIVDPDEEKPDEEPIVDPDEEKPDEEPTVDPGEEKPDEEPEEEVEKWSYRVDYEQSEADIFELEVEVSHGETAHYYVSDSIQAINSTNHMQKIWLSDYGTGVQ